MFFTVSTHNDIKRLDGFRTIDIEFEELPNYVMQYSYCSNGLVNGVRSKNTDNNNPTGYEAYDGKEDVVILDVDDSVTIEQAQLIFAEYECIIITTKSHRKDKGGKVCDRFRIFLRLDKTINDYYYRQTVMDYIYRNYDFVDQVCKSTNRLFFSSPSNSEVYINKGKRFVVSNIISKDIIPHSVTETAQISTNDSQVVSQVTSDEIYRYSEILEVWITDSGIVLENEKGETSDEVKLKGIKKFLDDEFYQGNKGNSLFSAGCIMKKDGFNDDFIVDYLLKEWEARNCSTDKFRDALLNIKNSLKY